MKRFFLLIAALPLIISCDPTHDQNEIPEIYTVEIDTALESPREVKLSGIGKELEYIPLESSDKSMLKMIEDHFSGFEMDDQYIFVSTFDQLFQFDITGRFIKQIGANGRGPGEYPNVSKFCLDKTNNFIYIDAWGLKKILKFDYSGLFIDSYELTVESPQYFVFDTIGFINRMSNTYNPNYSYNDHCIYIVNYSGDTLRHYENQNKRENGWVSFTSPAMYKYDGDFRFMEFGMDTLYTVTLDSLIPYAVFNLKKGRIEPDPVLPDFINFGPEELDKVFEGYRDLLMIDKVMEDKNRMYISLQYGLDGMSKEFLVFDKVSGETVCLLGGRGFENDIDGGIPFWPKYIYQDSILVDYVQAIDLKKYVMDGNATEPRELYGEKYEKLEYLVNSLDEMSNPVMVVLK